MSEENFYSDTDKGKPNYSEIYLSHCNFVHHKSNVIGSGSNPGLCGENPATDHCLSHGTAKFKD